MGQSASSRPKRFWPSKGVENQQVKYSRPVGHRKGIEGHFKTIKKDKMKKLQLKNLVYVKLEKSFRDWLKKLGYSESSVYNYPNHAREYLHWLEQNGQSKISKLNKATANAFVTYLKHRPHQRQGGSLSASHVNKQIFSLRLLFKYLKLSGQIKEQITIPYEEKRLAEERIILSEKEIKKLYDLCGNGALGQRDRAMLGVYYGCGLRRSEGLNLQLSEVLFDKNLLFVKESKNGWSRYVPMVKRVKEDLELYSSSGRKLFTNSRSTDHLFLSENGTALNATSLVIRLKDLIEKAGLSPKITLHNLRHSIGTHLIDNGMRLEQVSLFLGHRSLDSSQIYTHLKLPKWKK